MTPNNPLPAPLDLDALQAKAEAATKGPRGWFGNLHAKHIYLATRNNGRQFIMGFRRWGMQGAQPLFRKQFTSVTGKPAVIMTDASELAVKVAEYRDDIARIDNPDAEFIAACDPDTVLELIAIAKAAQAFMDDVLWTRPVANGLRRYDLATHGGPVGDLFNALLATSPTDEPPTPRAEEGGAPE